MTVPLSQRDHDRDREMVRLYLTGLTLQEVGNRYSVSRERVRQILKRQDPAVGHKRIAFNRDWTDALAMDRRRTKRLATKRRARAERCKQVAVVRTLYAELGRTPTRQEIGQAMGWGNGTSSAASQSAAAHVYIARWWSGRPKRLRGSYIPAVRRLMRLAGVPYRTLTDSKYDHDRIRSLRRAGWKWREIAAELGCSERTVAYALRRA